MPKLTYRQMGRLNAALEKTDKINRLTIDADIAIQKVFNAADPKKHMPIYLLTMSARRILSEIATLSKELKDNLEEMKEVSNAEDQTL